MALRINPDIDAGTHAKITTGRADNKFGIGLGRRAAALYARAATLPGLRPVGVGAAYRQPDRRDGPLPRRLRPHGRVWCGELRAAGHAVDTHGLRRRAGHHLPGRGGGKSPAALAGAIAHVRSAAMDLRLMIEPGRWLAGPAGLLLASVVLTKATGSTPLPGAGCGDERPDPTLACTRPGIGIVPISAAHALGEPVQVVDVVGPVCESGDTFARRRPLPPLACNARVAILDTGAYGAVMSSTYNARPLAAQVLVDAGRWATIRLRQPHAALWADETVPAWL